MTPENPAVTVSGDPVGGWIVEVHNGTHWECYPMHAETAEAASAEALLRFKAAHP